MTNYNNSKCTLPLTRERPSRACIHRGFSEQSNDIYSAIDEFEFTGTIEDWLDNEYVYDLDKLEDYDEVEDG